MFEQPVQSTTLLPARDKRQAMEWSLVLLSQGIESHILAPSEENGWALRIASTESSRAFDALKLYRKENRRWAFRTKLPESLLIFDWGCIAWVIAVAFFYFLDSRFDLKPAGVMDAAAVAHGEWHRVFTAEWLHADLSHLFSNLGIGGILLGLAMGRFGGGVALLSAYLAGAAGNLLHLFLNTGAALSLGASGMVMGALGLVTVQSIRLWKSSPADRKFMASAMAAGIFLFLFTGVSPETDVLAHAGGFVFGIMLGEIIVLAPDWAKGKVANLASAALFILLVVAPWARVFSVVISTTHQTSQISTPCFSEASTSLRFGTNSCATNPL